MKHGKVNGRIYLVFEDEKEFRDHFMKKEGDTDFDLHPNRYTFGKGKTLA